MPYALVSGGVVKAVFPNGTPPNPLPVPGMGDVRGAVVGWQGGGYLLANMVPFVVPNGQIAQGPPSYAYDGTNVNETYATVAAPAATIVATPTFLGRLSGLEQTNIYKAANTAMGNGNASYMFWLTAANTRGFIDLADPATVTVKAAIVTAGLLSQTRADAVFVP